MKMQLRPLNLEETSERDEGLRRAAQLVGASGPLTTTQVQALYDLLQPLAGGEPETIAAAGFAFGAEVVAHSDLEWARVIDEHGAETVLTPAGWSIYCAPLSMIKKRLQASDRVDIAEMRDGIIGMVMARLEGGELQRG